MEVAELAHLLRARDLLDREYARPLDVSVMARAALMSPSLFSRWFREAYGDTPYGYLQARRVERAMALLRSGHMSVTDVCIAVGFTSLGSFSSTFSRLVGESPSAYKARDHSRLAPVPPCMTRAWAPDLDEALAFYTQRLGFEVRDDVPMGPEMRWLTVHAPGDSHDLLLAAVDQHIPPADRQAMREIVAKGDLAVFIQVDDLDKTFESLRAAGIEILQEPVDQPYGVRDAAVRDPSGNHLRLSQPRD